MNDTISMILMILKPASENSSSEAHSEDPEGTVCLNRIWGFKKDAKSQHLLTTTPPSNMHPTIVVPVLVAFGNGTPLACNAALRVWLEKSKPGMLTVRKELKSSYLNGI
jgi:hypothetical protein